LLRGDVVRARRRKEDGRACGRGENALDLMRLVRVVSLRDVGFARRFDEPVAETMGASRNGLGGGTEGDPASKLGEVADQYDEGDGVEVMLVEHPLGLVFAELSLGLVYEMPSS